MIFRAALAVASTTFVVAVSGSAAAPPGLHRPGRCGPRRAPRPHRRAWSGEPADRRTSTPLEWAQQELKQTTQGRLVVVPGAGHSTQARAVSDVARTAVAGFLLN
jgi:hypothetical protein